MYRCGTARRIVVRLDNGRPLNGVHYFIDEVNELHQRHRRKLSMRGGGESLPIHDAMHITLPDKRTVVRVVSYCRYRITRQPRQDERSALPRYQPNLIPRLYSHRSHTKIPRFSPKETPAFIMTPHCYIKRPRCGHHQPFVIRLFKILLAIIQ